MSLKSIAQEKALSVLHKAIRPEGLLALATDDITENYTRVWARDSMMAGYAGILAGDLAVIAAMKSSLDTLLANQSPLGVIPSNVAVGKSTRVSYGGTAGRVDATLWYIVGVLLYYKQSDDYDFLAQHREGLRKAMLTVEYWEYNHKHLIYTPLSGNWADEYPLHGYTLYDNCLRLWGLELYGDLVSSDHQQKEAAVRSAIVDNYFFPSDNTTHYHGSLYQKTAKSLGSAPYPLAAFNPARYYDIFDCGGVGLALMLGLFDESRIAPLVDYLRSVTDDIGSMLIPAFWPVIHPGDPLWADVEMNYAYDFKNRPHHFHNGGIWPIMMGWLSLGLKEVGSTDLRQELAGAYLNICEAEQFAFSEYITSDSLQPAGKAPLCYSAAGLIMMLAQ